MGKLSSKTNWYVCKEGDRFSIRRTTTDADGNKKHVRLDREEYRSIEKNKEEIAKFVVRRNAKDNPGQKTRELQIVENAFISVALLDSFEAYLTRNIPTENYRQGIMGRVKNHFIDFFMNKLRLASPIKWHEVHEEKWSTYLNSKKLGLAPKTKRMIIQDANRFIEWMRTQRPDIPKLIFEPISPVMFNEMEIERESDESVEKPKMVSDKDWQVIKKNLPKDIAPFVQLAYHYGLRRGETLALDKKEVKNGYLHIQKQIKSIVRDKDGKATSYKSKPTKGRKPRKVSHWFCTASQTAEWVTQATSLRIMPDTLGQKWSDFMKTLNMDYHLHDFRHTWCTKAIRLHTPRDVQLGAKCIRSEISQFSMKFISELKVRIDHL